MKNYTEEEIEGIARTCHEVNRAFCGGHNDFTQLPWEEAEDWQKDSSIKGVKFVINNPTCTPAQTHDSWIEAKLEDGWVYGKEKDAEVKTHPCLVKYQSLSPQQRAIDKLFQATVKSF